MENLIIALIVPLVTALAYIAYAHHESFPKIERPIRWGAFISLTALNLFQVGTTVGRTWVVGEISAAKSMTPENKLAALDLVAEAGKNNDLPMFKITIIYVILAVYIIILSNLPKILSLDSKSEKEN